MEADFRDNLLIPSSTEVIKNRDLGRVKGHLTRHQRVAFASFVKNAYEQMIEFGENETLFSIDIVDFREELGINHRNIFAENENSEEYSVEKTLTQLLTKILEWRYKDETGKTLRVVKSVMLAHFEINRDDEKVYFSFSPFLQKKILCYGNAYIFEMPVISSFKSGYSVALFEQLEQRKNFGKWKVETQEFRNLMSVLDTEYIRIYDLKRFVIEVAIKEIESNSNFFNLKYKSIKKGRKITHFEFTWGVESKTKKPKIKTKEDIIEEMKNYIYLVNENIECKLIDLSITDEASEYIAILENENKQRAKVKTKADFNEAVEHLKLMRKK